jgi:hypothetical protein
MNKVCFVFALLFAISCNNSDENSKEKISLMKQEKSFFITDTKNNRHEIFSVMPDSFAVMQTEGKLSFCDSIYKSYNLNAYLLKDGKVIVQESSKYALYPSIEVLTDVLQGYKGPYKKELLEGLNPYGEIFPFETNSIISNMLKDFEINPELSPKEILQKLDGIIVKNRSKVFLDKYLMGFIAIIGKYNIEEFGGRWEMLLADDKKTWSPGIKINNQKVYFVSYILEDFLDSKITNPATEVFETVHDIIRINILGRPLNKQ